jgi:hypothetical protein
MLRIRRRAYAAGEDEVIASALALNVKPPGGMPHERVPPMQRAGDLREPLHERVAAFDVCQFV